MRFYDPLLFLTGHRGAIERIAGARHAWVVGALLVLTAGIARNYDHLDLLRQPEWFIGPFGASLVSIVFIYLCIERPLGLPAVGTAWRQLGTFLTFAWMTAPCAWLYGIPVESMTDLLTATKWNVAFLAIVALWRVLLMMRAVAVMTGVTHARAFVLILAPAALEAAVGSFFKGMSLVQIMGGVRLPPHTEWLREATSAVWLISSVVFIISLLLCGFFKGQAKAPLHRVGAGGSVRPALVMATLSMAAWVACSLPLQPKTANRHRLEMLTDARDHSGAVAFAMSKSREDFPRIHHLPPEPDGWFPLALLDALPPDAPEWLREEWYGNAAVSLEMRLSISGDQFRNLEENHSQVAESLNRHADELRMHRRDDPSAGWWLETFDRIKKEAAKERDAVENPATPLTPEDPIDPK